MTLASDPAQLSSSEKDELIIALQGQVKLLTEQLVAMEAKIKELEGRLALNSENSSKPPSADGLSKKNSEAPQTSSLREHGKNKSGGQDGHPGNTLEAVASPDHIEQHQPNETCSCGLTLPAGEKVESRQVFDIPPVAPIVTEHQVFETTCRCGKVHRGQFPSDVKAHVQYGPNMKATVVHFTHHEMLPVARTSELMGSLFGLPVSEATVLSIQQEAVSCLKPIVDNIKKTIQQASVVHADETGMRAEGRLKWLHVAVTDTLVWMDAHDKRSKEAFDAFGILDSLSGVLVHDGLKSYRQFEGLLHALCNQHHLRELQYVAQVMEQDWAADMMTLLRTACHEVNESVTNTLAPEKLAYFQLCYEILLQAGEAQNPKAEKEPGKRGKAKQSKAFNLLVRLREYREDVWRFAIDSEVPFTNNIAEQAVRMSKVKQKISGCFRTMAGLENYCIIRSYIATLKKQGANAYDSMIKAFHGSPVMPCFG